jgi:hypothetical protein
MLALRHHERLAHVALLLAVAAFCGCGGDAGDDPTGPVDTFRLTVQVTDQAGEPVSGLRASLSPQIPLIDYPYSLAPAPDTGASDGGDPTVDLEVLDIVGAVVRSDLAVGQWDGRDDRGEPVHDGWYEYRLVVRDPDSDAIVDESRQPFLFIAADPEFYTAGETDSTGQFTVEDRRFVPGFWDLAPITLTDEMGEPFGEVVLTTTTRLTLLAGDGRWQVVTFEALDGPQTLSLLWLPQPPRGR